MWRRGTHIWATVMKRNPTLLIEGLKERGIRWGYRYELSFLEFLFCDFGKFLVSPLYGNKIVYMHLAHFKMLSQFARYTRAAGVKIPKLLVVWLWLWSTNPRWFLLEERDECIWASDHFQLHSICKFHLDIWRIAKEGKESRQRHVKTVWSMLM